MQEVNSSAIPAPSEVVRCASESVVGQRRALEEVTAALCLSAERARRVLEGTPRAKVIPPSPPVLVGPTGSGKSHLTTEVARAMGLDFLVVDCSRLTGEGWRGQSISDEMMAVAEHQAKYPLNPIIVILDEADKLVLVPTEREPSFNPQRNLLKLFDGGTIEAGSGSEAKRFEPDGCVFAFAGAFQGLAPLVGERIREEGGSCDIDSMGEGELLALAQADDLVSFGFMPELVGRLGKIIPLEPADAQTFEQILSGSGGMVERASNMMPDNCRFSVSLPAARAMASDAVESGLGARRLATLLNPFVASAWRELVEDEELVAAEVIICGGRLSLGFSSASETDPRRKLIRESPSLRSDEGFLTNGEREDEHDRIDAALGIEPNDLISLISSGHARDVANTILGAGSDSTTSKYLECLLIFLYCYGFKGMYVSWWDNEDKETDCTVGSCVYLVAKEMEGSCVLEAYAFGADSPGFGRDTSLEKLYWEGTLLDNEFSRSLFRMIQGLPHGDKRKECAREVARRLSLIGEGGVVAEYVKSRLAAIVAEPTVDASLPLCNFISVVPAKSRSTKNTEWHPPLEFTVRIQERQAISVHRTALRSGLSDKDVIAKALARGLVQEEGSRAWDSAWITRGGTERPSWGGGEGLVEEMTYEV